MVTKNPMFLLNQGVCQNSNIDFPDFSLISPWLSTCYPWLLSQHSNSNEMIFNVKLQVNLHLLSPFNHLWVTYGNYHVTPMFYMPKFHYLRLDFKNDENDFINFWWLCSYTTILIKMALKWPSMVKENWLEISKKNIF